MTDEPKTPKKRRKGAGPVTIRRADGSVEVREAYDLVEVIAIVREGYKFNRGSFSNHGKPPPPKPQDMET